MRSREQRTLVFLKPEVWYRRLIGRIIQRFEEKGLQIVAMKMIRRMNRTFAKEHYVEHKKEPFFDSLINNVTGGPIIAMLLQGKDAIAAARSLMGPTNGLEAPPGTIRGDFGISGRVNLVHGSDSLKSAKREIALFFEPHERYLQYDTCDEENYYDYGVDGELV